MLAQAFISLPQAFVDKNESKKMLRIVDESPNEYRFIPSFRREREKREAKIFRTE